MCQCGCEDKNANASAHCTYSTTEMQSSLPRGRPRGRTKFSPPVSNTELSVRRRLTYDAEDNDHSPAAGRQYPCESQSSRGFDSFRGTRGLAIVQAQPDTNAPLDYAGAVRRQNSNGRSRVSQRFRAALPPRGRTPCDPAYQSLPTSQVRGGCRAGKQY